MFTFCVTLYCLSLIDLWLHITPLVSLNLSIEYNFYPCSIEYNFYPCSIEYNFYPCSIQITFYHWVLLLFFSLLLKGQGYCLLRNDQQCINFRPLKRPSSYCLFLRVVSLRLCTFELI
jgi:hypothetical protein